jgi:hypothetical protein
MSKTRWWSGWTLFCSTVLNYISCIPILAGIPAASVHNTYLALGHICLALWGYASWSTMGSPLAFRSVSS